MKFLFFYGNLFFLHAPMVTHRKFYFHLNFFPSKFLFPFLFLLLRPSKQKKTTFNTCLFYFILSVTLENVKILNRHFFFLFLYYNVSALFLFSSFQSFSLSRLLLIFVFAIYGFYSVLVYQEYLKGIYH